MSLQLDQSVNKAASAFRDLWVQWLNPPGGQPFAAPGGGQGAVLRAWSRQNMVRTAIRQFTDFLPPLNIEFEALAPGMCGQMTWGTWTLQISSAFVADDSISYESFMDLCQAAYHESRHAEQVYRAAQGLAALAFAFPDTSQADVIQAASASRTNVASRVAMFSGKGLQESPVRIQLITNLLKIPFDVAQHADLHRQEFVTYAALPKPGWFKRQTVPLEVEEWMRTLAKQSLFGMTLWVEQNAGQGDQPYAMYKDLPVELDAHAIGDLVATATALRIGQSVEAHGASLRTDTALFGA